MPVFHTKTIESILEPVAQQVSKLVILHEEADDGNQMPDLSLPVSVVKKAADNLIKVGYETVMTSDDLVLKKEMPPALQRVEEACNSLQEAANILKKEPSSTSGKRTLIAGERGILQGVSTILLTFDESEVRKILFVCRQVLEYLSITELIEKMDDLVTYVKNLTPLLTKMTRVINAREKELTHQIHTDLLIQHLNQVKELTPMFISCIKISLIISLNSQDETIRLSILQNKEYLIKRLTSEIEETMRILQLTTHDEDSLMCNDLTVMKNKLNNFDVKLKASNQWLSNKMAACSGFGEKALRSALEDANFIESKLGPFTEKNRGLVNESIRYIRYNLNDLCNFVNEGQQKSVTAENKAVMISNQLIVLHSQLNQLILDAQANNTYYKIARTFYGKCEQANKWFNNPYFDSILGEQVSRLIINESKQFAFEQKETDFKQNHINLNHELEMLIEKLVNSIKLPQTEENIFFVARIGKQLNEKLYILNTYLNKCLVEQVVDDFLDIHSPIKKLTDIVMSNENQDFRQKEKKDKFEKTSDDFIQLTCKLCNTAQKLASLTNQTRNKRTFVLINELTNRIMELAPQILNAANVVLSTPNNSKSLIEHFDLMQHQWQLNMISLQQLVDESIDSVAFIEACEFMIVKETFLAQTAIQENNKPAIVRNVLNIGRRTNRIIQVASQEAENSEENSFVNNIVMANEELKECLTPMINASKLLAHDHKDKENFLHWTQSNEKLMTAINKVKETLSYNDLAESNHTYSSIDVVSFRLSENITSRSSLSSSIYQHQQEKDEDDNNIQSITINEGLEKPEGLFRYYKVSRPIPLPDLLEEKNEKEFLAPKLNQPILMAAHDLHSNVNQWDSSDNEMIAAAKRITLLMAKLSSLLKREADTNRKELIGTAKKLADESFEFTRLAKLLAHDCTDKRMRTNLLQNCERIPTIGTQLKILSTVKATMLKGENENGQMSRNQVEDQEATEMLIYCAQNLNLSVKATCSAAKSASIKLKADSSLKFKWIRKRKNNSKS